MSTLTLTMQPESASGLLLVDKPQGVTSFDVVAAVRGALHMKKVGHAGTLDPMATGLLVVGFGNATRLLTTIVEHDKTYEATIRLGLATTTDDAEGELLPRSSSAAQQIALLNRAAIVQTIADRFTGDITQVPNTYSAIKIHGRRAYDLARDGQDVQLAARPVHISAFDVLAVRRDVAAGTVPTSGERHDGEPATEPPVPVPDPVPVLDVDVRVSCSSGTYIRALARDLGAALGTGGYLTRLRRTRVGQFALADDAGVPSGASGDAASGASGRMPDRLDAPVITAHTVERQFTNRDGESVTRLACRLDMPAELSADERTAWLRARAIPMGEAVRQTMPVLPISAEDAAELRFGRRITHSWQPGITMAAAVVPGVCPADDDVVALVTPAHRRTRAQPATVFRKGTS